MPSPSSGSPRPSVLRGHARACPPVCSSCSGCAVFLGAPGGGGRSCSEPQHRPVLRACSSSGLPPAERPGLDPHRPAPLVTMAVPVLPRRPAGRITFRRGGRPLGSPRLVRQNGRAGSRPARSGGLVGRCVVLAGVRPRQAVDAARGRRSHDLVAAPRWRAPARPARRPVEGAPPALDLLAVGALAYLGLTGRLGYVLWFRGLTLMDAAASPHRTRQPRRRYRARRRPARGALRSGAPRRRRAHPRQRPARPGAGAACPAPPRSRAPSGADPPWRRARAYGGGMPTVTTKQLTTPTGPVEIPTIGFGVWQVPDDEADAASRRPRRRLPARRHGRRLRQRGRRRPRPRRDRVARDDVFVTTKVWNADQGRDETLRAFDASMERLGLDVLDLYLIHWPTPRTTATSTPGGPCGSSRPTGGSARSACATSTPSTSTGCTTRRATGRASTRSSCTPTSSRRSCGRSTPRTASSPSRGRRSPRGSGARRPGDRPRSPGARRDAGAGCHRVAPRPRPRRAPQVGDAVANRREPRGGRPRPHRATTWLRSPPSTEASAPARAPTGSTRPDGARPGAVSVSIHAPPHRRRGRSRGTRILPRAPSWSLRAARGARERGCGSRSMEVHPPVTAETEEPAMSAPPTAPPPRPPTGTRPGTARPGPAPLARGRARHLARRGPLDDRTPPWRSASATSRPAGSPLPHRAHARGVLRGPRPDLARRRQPRPDVAAHRLRPHGAGLARPGRGR